MLLLQQIPSSTPPVIRTRFKVLLKLRAVLFMSNVRIGIRLELMHTQQATMIAAISTCRHNIFRLMPYLIEAMRSTPSSSFRALSILPITRFRTSALSVPPFAINHWASLRASLINISSSISQNFNYLLRSIF